MGSKWALSALGVAMLAVGLVALPVGLGARVSPRVGTPLSASATRGGVVRWAELPGTSPNWILPIVPGAQFSVVNLADFIPLLYKPLYSANFNTPTVSRSMSLAYPPVWSDNDTVVTIRLKHYLWTDGRPVTARDVTFFINLARAAGPDWGDYEPGDFPANLRSVRILGPTTLRLQLTKAYNPTYYTDNWLSIIVPLPQSVWDRESLHGRVGNYDEGLAGAKKVWSFLDSYASHLNTYSSTNPIWGVTDGPYRLESFGQSSSPDVFVPNPTYSGHRSRISRFEELPFTSTSAEYNILRSGSSALTVGYVPIHDVPTLGAVRSGGFLVEPEHYWGIAFMVPNLANPELGAVFRQLYVRQALQHLVDQPTIIKSFFHGYGVSGDGPVPVYPATNDFLTAVARRDPYPYSVAAAKALLQAHRWRIVHGVQTCESVTACGKGVKKGTRLAMKMLFPVGSTSSAEEMELYQSDAEKAGVAITLQDETFNTIIGIMNPCTPGSNGVTASSPVCTWQIGTWGGSTYSWTYNLFPSGGQLFVPGSADDSGLYSDPEVTRLIEDSRSASTLSPFYAYENLTARQVPYIWLPLADGLEAVAKNLRGEGILSEYGTLAPNRWYFAGTR